MAPMLTPNVPGRVSGDGLHANVSIKRSRAGNEATIQFDLIDANGRPATDIQPYLGARGHLAVLSREGNDYVHAHPIERNSEEAANIVSFHVTFPNAGLYKGWGQFRQGESIRVVPFVMDVN
jgi:hypothetical protein